MVDRATGVITFNHAEMLRDRVRCVQYREAILREVRPADVVVDVGAGTGILSVFAAQAGARKVFAVECEPVADIARQLVDANGVADRVAVIEGRIEDVELDEPVDLVISEGLGSYGVDEMLVPLLRARDRFLARDRARVVPRSVVVWGALACVQGLVDDRSFWRCKPYGVDVGLLWDHVVARNSGRPWMIEPEDLVTDEGRLLDVDYRSASVEAAKAGHEGSTRLTAKSAAPANCLVLWFSADLGNGIELTNAPGALRTHWHQAVFPLNEPRTVDRGEALEVQLTSVALDAAPWVETSWEIV